jgi:hypothetical protein
LQASFLFSFVLLFFIFISPTHKHGSIHSFAKIKLIDPKEIFVSMINNKGVSIAEVLIFFVSFIGCAHCQGTLDYIVDLAEQLLLLNVIPVFVHNESEEKYQEWSKESERTLEISQKLLHLQRNKQIKKHFKMKSFSLLKYFEDCLSNASISETKRLAFIGINRIVKYKTNETSALLAACFVVSDCKVITYFSKESNYQRFDLARIVIDTDGTGIEVLPDIYSCDYSGIKKEKKIEIQETNELKKLTSTKNQKRK